MIQNIQALRGIADKIFLSDRRSPVAKVLLFDQTDTMSDIVLGNHAQVPLDITECVTRFSITTTEDEASSANLTIVPNPLWEFPITPYHFMGNKIIRIMVADLSAITDAVIDYVPLFTGVAVGQPGYRRNRQNNEKTITVSCIDRTYFYNKRSLNSPDFVQGLDIGDIAVTIATDSQYGMGLQRQECRFGLFRQENPHTKISVYDVSYMEGLEFLGFVTGRQPAFDGAGFLIMRDTSIDKVPVRVYQNESLFSEISWPENQSDVYNSVLVIGQEAEMTKVVSPKQALTTIRGTIGYFENQYSTTVYFSEDRQARAQNVEIMEWSMNGAIGQFIGSKKPKLKNITEFSCVVTIATPYNSYIFIVFFAVYIAFFLVSGLFGGFFSAAADVAAAIWLCAGLAIMQQMGTFECTIGGEPFTYVYKELEGRAEWADLLEYEKRPLEINNSLVSTQELADEIAKRELAREAAKLCQRNFTIPFDPLLEPADVIELPDGTRYYITQISRDFERGTAPLNMNITALVVRNGKEYNQEAGFSEY